MAADDHLLLNMFRKRRRISKTKQNISRTSALAAKEIESSVSGQCYGKVEYTCLLAISPTNNRTNSSKAGKESVFNLGFTSHIIFERSAFSRYVAAKSSVVEKGTKATAAVDGLCEVRTVLAFSEDRVP